MRAIAIFLSIVLLVLPLAGGLAPLAAPTAPAAPGPAAAHVPPLPHDLSDADLVLLLAAHVGLHPERPALAPLAPEDTVASLALRLAHRSGAHHATPHDFAAFAHLDPRVALPVATLLRAIDQAWDIQEAATAGLDHHDRRALARLVLDGRGATPEALALGEPVDRTALVAAAILLLDTAESLVLPPLQDAARAGAWPTDPVSDPIGILRIGGTGDDHETIDRLLQIDPRGNDTYHNNAGGTTLLADFDPTTPDYPIALSVDFEGDDEYDPGRKVFTQGGAFLGIGLNFDFFGNDKRTCLRLCMGSGSEGIGIIRDLAGDDEYLAGDSSLGYATFMGSIRDDSGEDAYVAGTNSGAFAFGYKALALLWERQGTERYGTPLSLTHNRYGWAEALGSAFFVDEGISVDTYSAEASEGYGCNDCTWERGAADSHGLGNDNVGGLSHVLTRQRLF